MLEFQLKLIGGILSILAFAHIAFPKYFLWKKELQHLSLINRQMMQVHTLFIAITVLFMGLLCITSSHELVTTVLGKRISLGLTIFWGIRLGVQFFGYSVDLWKGKTFETTIHVIFSILWGYFTAVFFMAWYAKDILF